MSIEGQVKNLTQVIKAAYVVIVPGFLEEWAKNLMQDEKAVHVVADLGKNMRFHVMFSYPL